MIVRKGDRSRWTVIDNDILEDETLTFRDKGLLAFLLSKPDGWKVRSDFLANEGPDGRDAVRTSLNALEARGYISRTQVHDGHGRFHTETVVYEQPCDVSAGQTSDGVSGAGGADAGEGVPLVSTDLASTETNSRVSAENLSLRAEFDLWWAEYPRKEDKQLAFMRYKARRRQHHSAEDLLAACQVYARDRADENPQFTMKAKNFLGVGDGGCWTEALGRADEPDPNETRMERMQREQGIDW